MDGTTAGRCQGSCATRVYHHMLRESQQDDACHLLRHVVSMFGMIGPN